MAHSWDHERDKQLLVAILAVHSPLDFAAIAKAMGPGATTAAVRQHVHGLKARQGSQSPTKDKADKPSRGRKTTKAAPKRKSASLSKSENDTAADNQDQDEDNDGHESSGSPTKQRKL
ncbi:hypothetical protein PENVUL_c050G01130 [Penicillium vulpinum]|uniref:Myb-like domain-containing protein n=2 Tax=Penicillium vulpinum TaxID=29845 RepID=A0A1V6RFF9_9EURO|nr:hypothetical protein PENVUL_c050G01130 [Penicillium vulpinum]